MEMAGFVKEDCFPVPVACGGRAAAGDGADAALPLSSEPVSLKPGRNGLSKETSCRTSVVQIPACTVLSSVLPKHADKAILMSALSEPGKSWCQLALVAHTRTALLGCSAFLETAENELVRRAMRSRRYACM